MFYLQETSTILQHSSKHSLVLIDELGRGTATYGRKYIFFTTYHGNSLILILSVELGIQTYYYFFQLLLSIDD